MTADVPGVPLVIALPALPPGTVALTSIETGHRWELRHNGWHNGIKVHYTLGELLQCEGAMTPATAPPRRWSRVVHTIGPGGWPGIVEVIPVGRPTERWTLVTDDGLYTGPVGGRYTLIELRTLGDVVEVRDDAARP